MKNLENSTIETIVGADAAKASFARALFWTIAGSLALAVSAKLEVPFYPVPMTLQSLVVLLLGPALGSGLAAATVALYLLEGFLGLPVFAGATAGPTYFFGPTAGYLAGFLVAAWIVGALSERGSSRSWRGAISTMAAGHYFVFVLGFSWLACLLGPAKALAIGVVPFLWATVLKTLLAVALVRAAPTR